jgi:hypothetical protein
MAPNRIMRGPILRRALLVAATATMLAAALSACGGGGSSTKSEEEQDAKVLNDVLGRQLAVVETYEQVLPNLRGHDLAMASQFRTQEQEHVDATTKLLRGIGAEADPAAETIEASDSRTRADNLEFLYEMESATIDHELSSIEGLSDGWSRQLLAAMAANQAQRLVLLRRALGAAPLETVPSAFETGEIPAPERTVGK